MISFLWVYINDNDKIYTSVYILANDRLPFRQFTDISCIHLSASVVPYGQINAGSFVRNFHRSHIMTVLCCIWFTCLIQKIKLIHIDGFNVYRNNIFE